MAIASLWNWKLQNLWPFSNWKLDDLRVSDRLVRKLAIPDQTKQFVYAVCEPESKCIIYVLCAQNLSERSALDSECLIKAVRPDAVIAQIGHGGLSDVLSEECELGGGVDHPVPTSSFGVLKRCFFDKINKEKYENVAGKLVLSNIFGSSFHGNFFAARKAAEEVGSSFLILESQFGDYTDQDSSSSDVNQKTHFPGLVNSLVPQRTGSIIASSSRKFSLTSDIQSQMVKIVSTNLDASAQMAMPMHPVEKVGSEDTLSSSSYEAPHFAQSVYALLLDLHNIFNEIPLIGRALAHAQKMLVDVSRGNVVDSQIVSEVYSFRIAIEGLRIALNNAARLPVDKIRSADPREVEFAELPLVDKAQVLFAQTLQNQAKKFKTVVAVVDASALAGLRKHWNTPVPRDVSDMIGQFIIGSDVVGESSNHGEKKRLLTGKSVAAVGAGATAVLGASSISKAVPASTFIKLITFNIPAPFKIMFSQTQKIIAVSISKSLGPSKLVAPGLAKTAAKSSTFKVTASAEKIRALVHGVITSAEKTSLSAMRTAFYQIMRKRQVVQPVGFLPWATIGCSVATCTGLLVYGDGIECVAESLPAAPSIASLGRGIQSLHQASEEVIRADSSRIQKTIDSLMYRLKKIKIQ